MDCGRGHGKRIVGSMAFVGTMVAKGRGKKSEVKVIMFELGSGPGGRQVNSSGSVPEMAPGRVVLFAPRPLSSMDRAERVRAAYLHACLRYVNRKYLTNTSVRQRFGIEARNSAKASRVIAEGRRGWRYCARRPDSGPQANALRAGVGEGRGPRSYLIRCR